MNVWYMVQSGESKDCPDDLWESSDRDGDGYITWDEFDDLKGAFRCLFACVACVILRQCEFYGRSVGELLERLLLSTRARNRSVGR